jgi:hypothetical protein
MLRRFFLSCALTVAFLLGPSGSALAASTWYVNGVSGSDTNTCTSSATACKTIGHAIALAASGDTITIAAATYTENLTISISLTIRGASASTTIVDGHLDLPSSTSTVTIAGLTIQNGFAVNGGGINNNGLALTIVSSTVSGNRAVGTNSGGFGGGIYNASGTLTLRNVTVSNNQATAQGIDGSGGGIYTHGPLTITSSTVSGNYVEYPGVNALLQGGGIYSDGGKVTITNSTLSDNYLFADAIGAIAQGGGIWTNAKLSLTNSTVSGNSASAYGGGFGGGIYVASGVTALQDTILANSPSGGNCQGMVASHGYNLSSDATCALSGPGDLNNTDPMLGPLQNNGGPTQTQALLTGSPAIDAGNPSGCTGPTEKLLTKDQRGQPRPDPEDAGGGCDIGAYESQTD